MYSKYTCTYELNHPFKFFPPLTIFLARLKWAGSWDFCLSKLDRDMDRFTQWPLSDLMFFMRDIGSLVGAGGMLISSCFWSEAAGVTVQEPMVSVRGTHWKQNSHVGLIKPWLPCEGWCELFESACNVAVLKPLDDLLVTRQAALSCVFMHQDFKFWIYPGKSFSGASGREECQCSDLIACFDIQDQPSTSLQARTEKVLLALCRAEKKTIMWTWWRLCCCSHESMLLNAQSSIRCCCELW